MNDIQKLLNKKEYEIAALIEIAAGTSPNNVILEEYPSSILDTCLENNGCNENKALELLKKYYPDHTETAKKLINDRSRLTILIDYIYNNNRSELPFGGNKIEEICGGCTQKEALEIIKKDYADTYDSLVNDALYNRAISNDNNIYKELTKGICEYSNDCFNKLQEEDPDKYAEASRIIQKEELAEKTARKENNATNTTSTPLAQIGQTGESRQRDESATKQKTIQQLYLQTGEAEQRDNLETQINNPARNTDHPAFS